MKILIIGGGNMGLTYAQSFLRSHITSKKDMMILEKSQEKAIELNKNEIGTVNGHPQDSKDNDDIIIIAKQHKDAPNKFSFPSWPG